MRILFADQFGELGGAQHCLLDLLPAVRERGWEPVVLAPPGPLLGRARGLGAETCEIACGPYGAGRKSAADVLRFAREAPRLGAVLRNTAADLLYINGPRLLPAAALAAGRPVIFHAHSRMTRRYAVRLTRWALRRARATVIANSRFALEPWPGMHARVVYNGVAAPAATRRDAAEFRIGVIGRIAPQKGQAEFLRAARGVPGARFVVCGAPLFGHHGYARLVDRLAADLTVEFTGWQDDTTGVLAGLDLLVVPSIGPETTTRVILEAFAAGVPVLAARTGGIPEVVEHGVTGFLLDPIGPDALAAAMRELMCRSADLQAVAARARNAWRERFTLERYRREVIEIIEQTLPASRETTARQAAPR